MGRLMFVMNRLASLIIIAGIAVPLAHAEVLGPGSKAPQLVVGKWVKGKPVTSLAKGTYVVEFWATWCGPCRESIPHVTELAKKNPQVKFVGVSIWEDQTPLADIEKFVKGMGANMDYNVTVDKDKFMSTNWMAPAKQPGIPSAFIVKDGVIQWVGHPTEMDKPLSQVVAGKFDVKASRAAFDKEMKDAEEREAMGQEIEGAMKLLRENKPKEALAELDRLAKKYPGAAGDLMGPRKAAEMMLNPAKGMAEADALIKDKKHGEAAQLLEFFPKHEVSDYIADRVLSTAPEDVLIAYNVANYALTTENKALGLRAVGLAEKALPKSQFNNDNVKGIFAKMRKQLEGMK